MDFNSKVISVQDLGLEIMVIKLEDEQQESYKLLKRYDFVMFFMCKVCEICFVKIMSCVIYEMGIVIVCCFKCWNFYLIVDWLGWFGELGSVEDFLEYQGVFVRKGLEVSYEFLVEDLVGWILLINENKK